MLAICYDLVKLRNFTLTKISLGAILSKQWQMFFGEIGPANRRETM